MVTLIRPVVAPLGTDELMCESSVTENAAPVPLNFTALAPVSPVPVIVTGVVTGPLSGLKVVIVGVGEGLTVNCADVAVPPGVVTVMVPVLAPAGTEVLMC